MLLYRYLDDQNDPTVTTIKELAAQWVNTFPDVVADGETANWVYLTQKTTKPIWCTRKRMSSIGP